MGWSDRPVLAQSAIQVYDEHCGLVDMSLSFIGQTLPDLACVL